jgi:hypothetical protein
MKRLETQKKVFAASAGPWLRCFLSTIVFAAVASMSLPQLAHSQEIVDCVYPGHVIVSRVEGQVFDPFGVVVPGVVITLVDERGSTQKYTTDSLGRFRLAVSPGKYSFKAVFPMFQISQTELSVGEDLVGLLRPSTVYVILGLNGSYCAWVTTSRKEFRQIISSNKKRSEESTQRNATQK